MILSNNIYDILKWIAQYALPGAATLYFALAKIWGFPYPEQIPGTIMALDAFLGLLLGLSNSNYKKATQESKPSPAATNGLIVSEERSFKILVQMSGGVYDKLVWVANVGLPALGTIVFALSGIWGFTYGDAIVGTIAAVDTFLGVLLGISSSQFKDARIKGAQENY